VAWCIDKFDQVMGIELNLILTSGQYWAIKEALKRRIATNMIPVLMGVENSHERERLFFDIINYRLLIKWINHPSVSCRGIPNEVAEVS
jgi:regulator of replication initiation timing